MIKRRKIELVEIEDVEPAENVVFSAGIKEPSSLENKSVEVQNSFQIEAIVNEQLLDQISLLELFDDDERMWYSERTAIMEYDGKVGKTSAENHVRNNIINSREHGSKFEENIVSLLGGLELKGDDNYNFQFGGSNGYYSHEKSL